jgi:hypothetical protein
MPIASTSRNRFTRAKRPTLASLVSGIRQGEGYGHARAATGRMGGTSPS